MFFTGTPSYVRESIARGIAYGPACTWVATETEKYDRRNYSWILHHTRHQYDWICNHQGTTCPTKIAFLELDACTQCVMMGICGLADPDGSISTSQMPRTVMLILNDYYLFCTVHGVVLGGLDVCCWVRNVADSHLFDTDIRQCHVIYAHYDVGERRRAT
jgi:hypothetical protein